MEVIMYRCGLCPRVCEPGQAMLRHRILRPNGNLEAEIPVCGVCHAMLARGDTLEQVRLIRTSRRAQPPVATLVPLGGRQGYKPGPLTQRD